MASKNLGAVIQRAISDGAFRRQLQSDPATALRGFNLTPNEVAAIRSGDSGKLISLGVDQRMSKLFAVDASGAQRQSVSDLAVGSTSSTLTSDATTNARAIIDNPPFDGRSLMTDVTLAGTRQIHNTEPVDIRDAVTTGDPSSTRAIFNTEPADLRGTASVGDGAVGSGGNMIAADDNYAVSSRMAESGDAISIRPINDVAPFEGNVDAAASSGTDIGSGDARLDPGTEGGDHGSALGPTGSETGNEHGWG